jgi:hypothetical protein
MMLSENMPREREATRKGVASRGWKGCVTDFNRQIGVACMPGDMKRYGVSFATKFSIKNRVSKLGCFDSKQNQTKWINFEYF